MPKKASSRKKRVSRSRAPKKRSSPVRTPGDIRVEKVLVENFVSLQKVMTNLSMKFDNLSTQISKLLDLFEISAKTLAKKDQGDMGKKMDALLEQNKTIARGLTLLHEPAIEQPVIQKESRLLPRLPFKRLPKKTPPEIERPKIPPEIERPQTPPPEKIEPEEPKKIEPEEYQKSISIKDSSDFVSE